MSARGWRLLGGWGLALLLALAFAALGRWQLARMHEKERLLAAAAQALATARDQPQPLLLAADPARAQAYDWAAGRGMLAGVTLWLDNQQRDGQVGVRMYCLLYPQDGAQPLLLDAGWWPLGGDRALPAPGCPHVADQAVRGLLAPPPAAGLAHGAPLARQADGRWLAVRLDLPAIAAALGLHTRIAPRVLRLDPVHRPGDAGVMLAPGQRDLDILANTLTPERHLGYAVQWFGLALAALVTAAVLTSRSRPR
ncbi:SURF1 family cytochrome oxidase biogenesis protein [Thermomonas sp.]|uniref:SURF1 family cytochrome oxidase biogenesis protein n=1 Tax=Thermomonas sp. TaxID=1971895 RepID=UPI003D0F7D08